MVSIIAQPSGSQTATMLRIVNRTQKDFVCVLNSLMRSLEWLPIAGFENLLLVRKMLYRPHASSDRVGSLDCLPNILLRLSHGGNWITPLRQQTGQGRGQCAARAMSRAGFQVLARKTADKTATVWRLNTQKVHRLGQVASGYKDARGA